MAESQNTTIVVAATPIAGRRFGKWVAITEPTRHRYRSAKCLCRCECGVERLVVANDLLAGRSRSCGCSRKRGGYGQKRPDAKDRASILERFLKFVSPEPTSGCWLWMGACSSKGYASFPCGFSTRGSRVSYQLFVGPIPDGLMACHRCDMPSCVNPDHLFLGTALDNARDAVEKGRCNNQQKTHCRYGHPLSGENITITKNGHRDCITCRVRYRIGFLARRRAERQSLKDCTCGRRKWSTRDRCGRCLFYEQRRAV